MTLPEVPANMTDQQWYVYVYQPDNVVQAGSNGYTDYLYFCNICESNICLLMISPQCGSTPIWTNPSVLWDRGGGLRSKAWLSASCSYVHDAIMFKCSNVHILGENRPRLHQQKFKLGKKQIQKYFVKTSRWSHMESVIWYLTHVIYNMARYTLTTACAVLSKPISPNWTRRTSLN